MDKEKTILALARNKDERMFVARCLDYAERASRRGVVLTPFLDPGQLALLKQVVARWGAFTLLSSGGYPDAERQRALIGHDLDGIDDFGVAILQIVPRGDDRPPEHRDYLGSLLGLGLKREKLGDIVPSTGSAYVFVVPEISEFVRDNLVKVGRVPVQVDECPFDALSLERPPELTKTVTVSSLRLDAVISAAWHMSRSESANLVAQGKVHLNWREVSSPAVQMGDGDTVSCRGYGRFRIQSLAGESRKGRLRVILAFPAKPQA